VDVLPQELGSRPTALARQPAHRGDAASCPDVTPFRHLAGYRLVGVGELMPTVEMSS
jgi:hypothetical protein